MSAFRKGYRSSWYKASSTSQAGSLSIDQTMGGMVFYGSATPKDNCAIFLELGGLCNGEPIRLRRARKARKCPHCGGEL